MPEKVVYASTPIQREKFQKNGFQAVAHQVFVRDQNFWHTFLFLSFFSLVKYLVTRDKFVFLKNSRNYVFFRLWEAVVQPPMGQLTWNFTKKMHGVPTLKANQ